MVRSEDPGDTVFLERGTAFEAVTVGTNVLRIRTEQDRVLFTLKQRHGGTLDKIEKEIAVSDGVVLAEILDMLGWYQASYSRKERRKCLYGQYEICLDRVEGLGKFIEVEKLSDEDGEMVQVELLGFLSSIGVDTYRRVTKGYDVLLHEKQLSFGDDAEGGFSMHGLN